MGRSIESIRQCVKNIAARWTKTSRTMTGVNRIYAERVIQKATVHSSAAFYGLDDPLEAAVFSVLVEMEKEMDELRAA